VVSPKEFEVSGIRRMRKRGPSRLDRKATRAT